MHYSPAYTLLTLLTLTRPRPRTHVVELDFAFLRVLSVEDSSLSSVTVVGGDFF